ncbi:MAG TPA: hypothetical protein VMV98_09445, partial [Acidobacteriaceae bacterium]|nr:hypothetical protein [Acidobacteriaceae bacterium]
MTRGPVERIAVDWQWHGLIVSIIIGRLVAVVELDDGDFLLRSRRPRLRALGMQKIAELPQRISLIDSESLTSD